MLIVCPNCATSFTLAPTALGAQGRSVRCARCRTVWFASTQIVPNLPAVPKTAAAAEPQTASSFDAIWPATGAADAQITEHDLPNAQPAAVEASPIDVPDTATEPPDSDAVVESAEHAPSTRDQGEFDSEEAPLSPAMAGEVAVTEAPPLAPITDTVSPLAVAAPPQIELPEDIETVAARRAYGEAARRHRIALVGLPTLAVALFALDASLIGRRADVVRLLPQTASLFAAIGMPVNLRGLSFQDVGTAKDIRDGVPVLVVEGTIVASGGRPVEVPRLRFAVRNDKAQEIYTWTAAPARSPMGAGDTQTFRSRLASPPAESHDVVVRFANRRDVIAGAK